MIPTKSHFYIISGGGGKVLSKPWWVAKGTPRSIPKGVRRVECIITVGTGGDVTKYGTRGGEMLVLMHGHLNVGVLDVSSFCSYKSPDVFARTLTMSQTHSIDRVINTVLVVIIIESNWATYLISNDFSMYITVFHSMDSEIIANTFVV